MDILAVAGELSRFLQTENLLVYEVTEGIDEAVMKLMSLKLIGGPCMKKFLSGYNSEQKQSTATGGKIIRLTGHCPDSIDYKDAGTTTLLDGITTFPSDSATSPKSH